MPAPNPPLRNQSDPDMDIVLAGQLIAFGFSPDENSETFTTQTLFANQTYVADLRDFRYADEIDANGTPDDYPEEVCFDVTFTPTP